MANYDAEIRVGTSVDTSRMQKMQLEIDRAENRAKKFADALEQAKNKKLPTQEYKDAQKIIADSEKELNKLIERQDELARKGKEGGAAWNELEYKIEQIKQKLRFAKSDAEDLVQEGRAFYIDTARIEGLARDYEIASRQAGILRQRQVEANGSVDQMGNSASTMAEMCARTAERIKAAFQSIPATIGHVFKSAAAACVSAMGKMASAILHPVNALKKLASAGRMTGKILSTSFIAMYKSINGVLHPLKTMRNLLGKVSGSGNKATNMLTGFTKRVMGLAKRVFIFSLITKAFRSMLTRAKEGLQNFAQVNAEYNKTMSDFKTSTETLKNSMATAFAPILNAVIPAITKLIGWINTAAAAVARFFAIMGGKKTYSRATKQVVDYVKGLDKTGESAKKASKSLAAFDELAVLSQDNDDSGGGGAAGVDPSTMFEDVNVGEVSDWAKSFKEAIDSGDWYGVGSLLAEKINTILASIDFSAIDAKMQKVATNIATGLNGFIENLNWKQIGETLASGLNVAINFLYKFVNTFNFGALGKGIADGINGFLAKTDWKKLGSTIGNALKGIIDFLLI